MQVTNIIYTKEQFNPSECFIIGDNLIGRGYCVSLSVYPDTYLTEKINQGYISIQGGGLRVVQVSSKMIEIRIGHSKICLDLVPDPQTKGVCVTSGRNKQIM